MSRRNGYLLISILICVVASGYAVNAAQNRKVEAELTCVAWALNVENVKQYVGGGDCGPGYEDLRALQSEIINNNLETAIEVGNRCRQSVDPPVAVVYCRRLTAYARILVGEVYSGELELVSDVPEYVHKTHVEKYLKAASADLGEVQIAQPLPVDKGLPNTRYNSGWLASGLTKFESQSEEVKLTPTKTGAVVSLKPWKGIVVDAAINGVLERLVVDTGAPFSAISQRVATAAGIRAHRSNVRMSLLTASQSVSTEVGPAIVAIGRGPEVEHSLRVVQSDEMDALGIDGILGLDLLRRFNSMTVSTSSQEITFGTFSGAGHCVPMRLIVHGNDQIVSLEARIVLDGKSVRWWVDTGMLHSLFGATGDVAQWLVKQGNAQDARLRFGDLVIGPEVFAAIPPEKRLGPVSTNVRMESVPGAKIDVVHMPSLDILASTSLVVGTPQLLTKKGFSFDIAKQALCIE